jgi:RNA polymerase sigma-70 factor (ECF subfamily)
MKKDQLIEIMNTYGDYLKKSAFYVLKDLDLAEDMVQETFISFYMKGHFKEKSSLKTYLYSILMNHIKMYLRKNKLKVVSDIYYTSNHEVVFEHESIKVMDLTNAISGLNDYYRMVIVLFYFDDLAIHDISKVLNKSKSSVKMALKRSRDQLKVTLGGAYESKIN